MYAMKKTAMSDSVGTAPDSKTRSGMLYNLARSCWRALRSEIESGWVHGTSLISSRRALFGEVMRFILFICNLLERGGRGKATAFVPKSDEVVYICLFDSWWLLRRLMFG